MDVVLRVRCGDEEEDLRRLTIQRIKFHAAFHPHESQARPGNGGRLGMGDRYAFTHTGTAFLFTMIDTLTVRFDICDVPLFRHQVDEHIQGLFLCLGMSFQIGAFRLQ